jgi:hypothetical protein
LSCERISLRLARAATTSISIEGGEERLDGGVAIAVASGAEGLVDLEPDNTLGEREWMT